MSKKTYEFVQLLDILALICAVMALGLAVSRGSDAINMMPDVQFNRYMSSLIASYCGLCGLAFWMKKKNQAFAMGLMMIGLAIIIVNIIASQL